jgi:hypothetical protein
MRRLPPSNVEDNLAKLCDLVPDLIEDLLSSIDQPLKIAHDNETRRDYLLCDYNRDGDSYRFVFPSTQFLQGPKKHPLLQQKKATFPTVAFFTRHISICLLHIFKLLISFFRPTNADLPGPTSTIQRFPTELSLPRSCAPSKSRPTRRLIFTEICAFEFHSKYCIHRPSSLQRNNWHPARRTKIFSLFRLS